MNLRPKLTEEIYKARIASLEGQVETLKETAKENDINAARWYGKFQEEREKHAKEILGYVSARNNLVLRFQRKAKVQWLKLFLVVLVAVIVGLCVWSGVGYAISHVGMNV